MANKAKKPEVLTKEEVIKKVNDVLKGLDNSDLEYMANQILDTTGQKVSSVGEIEDFFLLSDIK